MSSYNEKQDFEIWKLTMIWSLQLRLNICPTPIEFCRRYSWKLLLDITYWKYNYVIRFLFVMM